MVDGVRQRHRKRRTGRVGEEIEKARAIRLAQQLNLLVIGSAVARLIPGRNDEPHQPLLARHRPGFAGGSMQCRRRAGSKHRQQANAACARRQHTQRARRCRKARMMKHRYRRYGEWQKQSIANMVSATAHVPSAPSPAIEAFPRATPNHSSSKFDRRLNLADTGLWTLRSVPRFVNPESAAAMRWAAGDGLRRGRLAPPDRVDLQWRSGTRRTYISEATRIQDRTMNTRVIPIALSAVEDSRQRKRQAPKAGASRLPRWTRCNGSSARHRASASS
jgi:hypothetical protein